MDKKHSQMSKAGRNPPVEDNISLSEDDIDDLLDDHNSVGRTPMTASERKRREEKANSKIVRCKLCNKKWVQLRNLTRHVKQVHPDFYSAESNRGDYVAPLDQKEPTDPKFKTAEESAHQSDEDEY